MPVFSTEVDSPAGKRFFIQRGDLRKFSKLSSERLCSRERDLVIIAFCKICIYLTLVQTFSFTMSQLAFDFETCCQCTELLNKVSLVPRGGLEQGRA